MPTEYFKWWIVDERTGERRLTAYRLTRGNAEKAFPGAEPDPLTLELRDTHDPDGLPPNSRPGGDWA